VRIPILVPLVLLSCERQRTIAPDVAAIGDPDTWSVIHAETSVSVEDARRVLRLYPVGGDGPGSNVAMALVSGVDLAEGTVDVDLRGLGGALRSFVGVAFGVVDARSFEAIYFRPFNFQPEDPSHRVRAVQYVAWPEHTWEELRADHPGVYEGAVDPVPDGAGWFHARIEIARRTVRVFVNGAANPCLVVDRLAGRHGGVGLFVDSHEGWFSNVAVAKRG